jgi:hypothetical protein
MVSEVLLIMRIQSRVSKFRCGATMDDRRMSINIGHEKDMEDGRHGAKNGKLKWRMTDGKIRSSSLLGMCMERKSDFWERGGVEEQMGLAMVALTRTR